MKVRLNLRPPAALAGQYSGELEAREIVTLPDDCDPVTFVGRPRPDGRFAGWVVTAAARFARWRVEMRDAVTGEAHTFWAEAPDASAAAAEARDVARIAGHRVDWVPLRTVRQ